MCPRNSSECAISIPSGRDLHLRHAEGALSSGVFLRRIDRRAGVLSLTSGSARPPCDEVPGEDRTGRGAFPLSEDGVDSGRDEAFPDRLVSRSATTPRVEPPRATRLRPARAPCDEVPHLELPPHALPLDVLSEMEEELRDDDRSSAQSTLASPANVFTSLRYSGKTQSLEEEAHRDSDLQVVAKDMCRLGPVTILDCLASWGTSSPRVGPPRAPAPRPARAPCDEVPHLELSPPALPFDVLGELDEDHSIGSTPFVDGIHHGRSGVEGRLVWAATGFTGPTPGGKKDTLEEEAHPESDLQVVVEDMRGPGPVSILDCLASWGASTPRVGPPRAPQLRPARAPCDEVPHLELPPPSLPFDVLGESEESHSVGSLFFLDVIDDKQDSDSVSVETAQNCIIYDLEENDPYLSRGIKIFANVTIA